MNNKQPVWSREFWRATAIRCARTFITTILGIWTGGQLVTEIDWKTTLVYATSATLYIFLTCLSFGLPEVEYAQHIYMSAEEPEDSWIEEEGEQDGEE